jgi:predicted nucleic acid-binding protein
VRSLLDTNVVSEWVKPLPDPGVVSWLDALDEDRVFLSVITLAELRHGVERLSRGRRRALIEAWLEHLLPERFDDRVLPVETSVANAGGRVLAASYARGRPLGIMAAFLAATAAVHDLTLATRNVVDFERAGINLHNPWRA